MVSETDIGKQLISTNGLYCKLIGVDYDGFYDRIVAIVLDEYDCEHHIPCEELEIANR